LKDFEANQRSNVHRYIRNFVREEGVFKGRDIVLEKMVELIGQSLTPLKGSDAELVSKKFSRFPQKMTLMNRSA